METAGATSRQGEGRPLPFGVNRPNRVIRLGRRSLVWQPCSREARDADLVVVDQASRLLLNYWLLHQQHRGRTRVALWGHGENLNRPNASRIGEEIKRRMARMPHWWFAYTEGTRERVTRSAIRPIESRSPGTPARRSAWQSARFRGPRARDELARRARAR